MAESGAKIDIDDDGTIHIASPDAESCAIAKKCIDDIVFVPEVGKLYYGRVVRLMTFGAFVELAPGKDGLVHISKLADKRIEKVEDACKVGDMMWVKVMEIDEKGRVEPVSQGRHEGDPGQGGRRGEDPVILRNGSANSVYKEFPMQSMGNSFCVFT